ncbi:hypothetical protein GIB67_027933, partial [Kingdonia uniflora]
MSSQLVLLFGFLNIIGLYRTAMIVRGWDKYEGGKIYSVPLGGTILVQPFAIEGMALLPHFYIGYLRNFHQLVVKGVSLAIACDGASGGCGGVVHTVIINSEGVTKNFCSEETLPLWHEELEARNSLLDILEY